MFQDMRTFDSLAILMMCQQCGTPVCESRHSEQHKQVGENKVKDIVFTSNSKGTVDVAETLFLVFLA